MLLFQQEDDATLYNYVIEDEESTCIMDSVASSERFQFDFGFGVEVQIQDFELPKSGERSSNFLKLIYLFKKIISNFEFIWNSGFAVRKANDIARAYRAHCSSISRVAQQHFDRREAHCLCGSQAKCSPLKNSREGFRN
jgi:hypothetical protein